MNDKKSIKINGAINGIVNFGDNSTNINTNENSDILQLKADVIEQKMTNSNETQTKENKLSNHILKITIELIVGVVVSVIAGYILYKLNMN